MKKENILKEYLKDGLSNSAKRNHGIYLRTIRRLGFPFFWIFYKLNLTANTATFVGFLIEIVAAISFVFSQYLLAAVLVFVGIIFDFFDGVLARKRKEVGTLNTALLCSCHHFLTPTLIILAGFINYFLLTRDVGVLALALVVGVSSAMAFQLLSIRGRALFKYYHGYAIKSEEVLQGKKNLVLKGAEIVETVINHSYLLIALYVIEPLAFIGLLSILMPLRFVGFFAFFYFSNKKLEKKLVKFKSV